MNARTIFVYFYLFAGAVFVMLVWMALGISLKANLTLLTPRVTERSE